MERSLLRFAGLLWVLTACRGATVTGTEQDNTLVTGGSAAQLGGAPATGDSPSGAPAVTAGTAGTRSLEPSRGMGGYPQGGGTASGAGVRGIIVAGGPAASGAGGSGAGGSGAVAPGGGGTSVGGLGAVGGFSPAGSGAGGGGTSGIGTTEMGGVSGCSSPPCPVGTRTDLCPPGYAMRDESLVPEVYRGRVVDGAWTPGTNTCPSGCDTRTFYAVLSDGTMVESSLDAQGGRSWSTYGGGVTAVEGTGLRDGVFYIQNQVLRHRAAKDVFSYAALPEAVPVLSIAGINRENVTLTMSDHRYYRWNSTLGQWPNWSVQVSPSGVTTAGDTVDYLVRQCVWGNRSNSIFFVESAGSRVLTFTGYQSVYAFLTHPDGQTLLDGVVDMASCFDSVSSATSNCVGLRQGAESVELQQIKVWQRQGSITTIGKVLDIHAVPLAVTVQDLLTVDYDSVSGWFGDYVTTQGDWRSFYCAAD